MGKIGKDDIPSNELDADLKILFESKVTDFKSLVLVLLLQIIRELKGIKAK